MNGLNVLARHVRVSSISFKGAGRSKFKRGAVRNNIDAIIELLRTAAMDEPDIICLPENAPAIGLSCKDSVTVAEEIPGPISRSISSVAKEYGIYVICPMLEKKDGRVYNSAVLIDRRGDYAGSYHKIHPTIDEIKCGISPGTEQSVFRADFGTLGFAICFDLNFRDVIEGLAERGAKLVFFPSMYPGGLQLRMWALEFGVYVVSAYAGDGSMIVNPLGKVLATSDSYSPIISKTLNLDYEVLHLDYNNKKFNSIKKEYGPKVELEVTRPEAVFMLVSNSKDINADDVVRKFQLETRVEYFKRALKTREEALAPVDLQPDKGPDLEKTL